MSTFGSENLRSAAAVAALSVALGSAAAHSERRLDVDKLEKGYVETLDHLARGDRDQALELLITIEVEALGKTPTTSRIDRVWRHKLGVVRRALDLTSDEVLVPVIVLHHDAYEVYRDRKMPILARHARDMASDLASYMVQRTDNDSDRRFASWVMASFGASLLTLRTSGTSAGLLEDALGHAPDNPAALIGLAWAHEAHGEYQNAIERLDDLLAADPDHHQARLRWAVCQQRLGEFGAAESAFQLVLNQAEERWIRSVAHQELSRTHRLQGDLSTALAAAEAGLTEYPDDQELIVLAASLNERTGRRTRARDVVASIRVDASPEGSARYHYDSRPELNIEEARARLHRMQEDRLDVLAEGLRWWGKGTAAAEASTEGASETSGGSE